MCVTLRVTQLVHIVDWIMCSVCRVVCLFDPADFLYLVNRISNCSTVDNS